MTALSGYQSLTGYKYNRNYSPVSRYDLTTGEYTNRNYSPVSMNTGQNPDKTGQNPDKFDWLGTGQLALNTFTGLANAYLGMKEYGLAKDIFKQNKKEFALNYDANRRLTNARLRDRQAARVASNPGAYQPLSEYMDQNGIAARG